MKQIKDEDIIFDFRKLRDRIKEIYGTQTAFSTAMLMNEATLSNKLNNNVEFSTKEISEVAGFVYFIVENTKQGRLISTFYFFVC